MLRINLCSKISNPCFLTQFVCVCVCAEVIHSRMFKFVNFFKISGSHILFGKSFSEHSCFFHPLH